jgi:ATP-dependent DNA ligase
LEPAPPDSAANCIQLWQNDKTIYAAHAGIVPLTRRQVFDRLKPLRETTAGRWGEGLTAQNMQECVWVKPETAAQIEFLEWTGAHHLPHTKFIGLRRTKIPARS